MCTDIRVLSMNFRSLNLHQKKKNRPILILGVWYYGEKYNVAKPFTKSGDLYQMRHSAASDQGLHYLPVTLLGVSRLHWVKERLLKGSV